MRKSSANRSPDFTKKDDPILCRNEGPPDFIVCVQGHKLFVHSKVLCGMSRVIEGKVANVDPMMGKMLQMTSAKGQPPRRKKAVVALLNAIYPPRLLPPVDMISEVYDIAVEYKMDVLVDRFRLGILWSRDLSYLSYLANTEEPDPCLDVVLHAFAELTSSEFQALLGWENLDDAMKTMVAEKREGLLGKKFDDRRTHAGARHHRTTPSELFVTSRRSSCTDKTSFRYRSDLSDITNCPEIPREKPRQQTQTVFSYTWRDHLQKLLSDELDERRQAAGKTKLEWCRGLSIVDYHGRPVDIGPAFSEHRRKRNSPVNVGLSGKRHAPVSDGLSEGNFPVCVKINVNMPVNHLDLDPLDSAVNTTDATIANALNSSFGSATSFAMNSSFVPFARSQNFDQTQTFGSPGNLIASGPVPSPANRQCSSPAALSSSSRSRCSTLLPSPTISPIWRTRARPRSAPHVGISN